MTAILNAEDHAPARFLRSRLLADAGFDVAESASAQATIEAALNIQDPPSLVLLDVGLPDGNGFDVCERIKVERPTLPVVLISAVYRTAHARRDGISVGADAYLVEPTPPERLIGTIRRLTIPGERAPTSPVAAIRTNAGGTIVWVNDVAARLLNVGARAAPGRSLLTFFNGGRSRLQEELTRAVAGQVCEIDAELRPRERKPFLVHLDLAAASERYQGEIEWIVAPAPDSGRGPRAARDVKAEP